MFDFVWRQFGLNMLSRTHYTYIYIVYPQIHMYVQGSSLVKRVTICEDVYLRVVLKKGLEL